MQVKPTDFNFYLGRGRNIPYKVKRSVVFIVKIVRNTFIYRDAVFDFWNQKFFKALPNSFFGFVILKFWNFAKNFVAIINQWDIFQTRNKVIWKQRIEVIGVEE